MLVQVQFLKILRKIHTNHYGSQFDFNGISFWITYYIQFQTYNQEEGVTKGFEGIEYQKTQYEDISVSLTNEVY